MEQDDLITCRHCDYQLPDEGGACPRCERDRDTGRYPGQVFGTSSRKLRPAVVRNGVQPEDPSIWNGVES